MSHAGAMLHRTLKLSSRPYSFSTPRTRPMEQYIHGFSASEQLRLVEQAAALAPAVFSGLNLEAFSTLLEVGCGVGAQTKHLLDYWPHLRITSIDRNSSHLTSAAQYLSNEIASGRVALKNVNAEDLPFHSDSFDVVLTIWVLEHASHPRRILEEALRVLRPGGLLILNEVDNETFGFTPANRTIHDWWQKFNTFQRSGGADPFIGQRLRDLAIAVGFEDIVAEPLYLVSSQREPNRRLSLLRYLRDLLLSGTEAMKKAGLVDDLEEERLRKEFSLLESQPETDFQYSALRLKAIKSRPPA